MKSLPRSVAKDLFSYLLAIVTLYVGIISFITLLFEYINIKFPDLLNYYYSGSLDTIRGAMAGLIVVWPMYLLISWFINKERKADTTSEPWVRKWLLYLTLFLTAIAMIVDLVTLVNYFLNGEISVRFILKVLVMLLTAGGVFWYELWELKHEAKEATKVYKQAAIASIILVVGVIVAGFLLAGSPTKQRQVRFDDQRAGDLQNIQYEIGNYYQQKQTLPASLNDLHNDFNNFTVPTDPETKAAYEYRVSGALTFSLCATFLQETANPSAQDRYAPYGDNWNHAAGHTCFDRTLDPDMYPPVEVIAPLGAPDIIKVK